MIAWEGEPMRIRMPRRGGFLIPAAAATLLEDAYDSRNRTHGMGTAATKLPTQHNPSVPLRHKKVIPRASRTARLPSKLEFL
jgi:hypothetical protein